MGAMSIITSPMWKYYITRLSATVDTRIPSTVDQYRMYRNGQVRNMSICIRSVTKTLGHNGLFRHSLNGTGTRANVEVFTLQLQLYLYLYLYFGIRSVPVPIPLKFCLNKPSM